MAGVTECTYAQGGSFDNDGISHDRLNVSKKWPTVVVWYEGEHQVV